MSMKVQWEQLLLLKSKKNFKHESETINLINGSIWNPDELDYKNFQLKNDINKVHFKTLKSIK